MSTTFEAIRISSGNSFVHETESQVILNDCTSISFRFRLGLVQEADLEEGIRLLVPEQTTDYPGSIPIPIAHESPIQASPVRDSLH